MTSDDRPPSDQHRLKKGQFSLGWLLWGVTLAALLTGLVGMALRWDSHWKAERQRQAAERQRQDAQDRVTVEQIVVEVEAIRARVGRAPRDEQELVSLLGKPMPHVHDGRFKVPISYQRTGEDSFMLQYELWATDDWIYDSTKPKSGWVQHYY